MIQLRKIGRKCFNFNNFYYSSSCLFSFFASLTSTDNSNIQKKREEVVLHGNFTRREVAENARYLIDTDPLKFHIIPKIGMGHKLVFEISMELRHDF